MIPAANLSVYTDSISSMYTSILEMLGRRGTVRAGQPECVYPLRSCRRILAQRRRHQYLLCFAPFEGAYLAVIRSDFNGTEPDSAAALGEAFGYAAELTPADIL